MKHLTKLNILINQYLDYIQQARLQPFILDFSKQLQDTLNTDVPILETLHPKHYIDATRGDRKVNDIKGTITSITSIEYPDGMVFETTTTSCVMQSAKSGRLAAIPHGDGVVEIVDSKANKSKETLTTLSQ